MKIRRRVVRLCWGDIVTALGDLSSYRAYRRSPWLYHWVWACILVSAAVLVSARAQTNDSTRRLTVAVTQWNAQEQPPLSERDRHWLLTFSRLVAAELREVGVLRVLPEEAVKREVARQTRHTNESTNSVVAMQKMRERLGAQHVVGGTLGREGASWTVHASVADTSTGNFTKTFKSNSTNWFQLRDEVVQYVLRSLQVAPTASEQRRLGRIWTPIPDGLESLSIAAGLSETNVAQALELCRKVLAKDPSFVQARSFSAGILYNLGQYDAAVEQARLVLGQDPALSIAAQMRQLAAMVLLMKEQDEQAAKEVELGLRAWPEEAGLWSLQANLQREVKDFEAAEASLRRASECDPGNPLLYAQYTQIQVQRGDLTNALRNLGLAEKAIEETHEPVDVNVALVLGRAFEETGNRLKALRYYGEFLARAEEMGLPESRVSQFREHARELERGSEPVPVPASMPRSYSTSELKAALHERLSGPELAVAVNPLENTPEMADWARTFVSGTEGDLARARKLFEELNSRPKAAGSGSRTAAEVFALWRDLSGGFSCQEYAKLFVALGRTLKLSVFYVHVDRDYSGRVVDHDCAVVFANEKSWLVDPAYAWFGVPHREFRVLDDVQTVAHHAFQPHDAGLDVKLCQAGCKLDPDFIWGRLQLVSALYAATNLPEARKQLAEVRQRAPAHWRVYQLEGALAGAEGRRVEALQWLERAVEANPGDGNTRLFWARVLFEAGKPDRAREEFLAGLRLPHNPKNEQLVRETVAVISEALNPGSNSTAFSASGTSLNAGAYQRLGLSFLSAKPPDYTQAAKAFAKAAEMGNVDAQLALGLLYWTGNGVPQNPEVAVSWYTKAALGGNAEAMRNLGIAYGRGIGVKRGIQESLKWFQKAAEGGDLEAQVALGKAYYEGAGVTQNTAEALFWLLVASETSAAQAKDSDSSGVRLAERGPVSLKAQLGALLKEVQLFVTPEEAAAAKARARTFKPKEASSKGQP